MSSGKKVHDHKPFGDNIIDVYISEIGAMLSIEGSNLSINIHGHSLDRQKSLEQLRSIGQMILTAVEEANGGE